MGSDAGSGLQTLRYQEVRIACGGERKPTEMFTALRIVRVASGRADWMIGGHVHRVSAGDVALLGSAVPRSFFTVYPPEGINLEVYEFTPAAVGDSLDCLDVFRLRARDCVVHDFGGELAAELLSIREEIRSAKPLGREMIRARLVVLLVRVARRLPAPPKDLSGSDGRAMAGAASYIWNHLDEDLRVSSLARKFGMCRGRFSSLFTRYHGIGALEYTAGCRCRSVIWLIRGGMNVLDAAMKSGFDSASGFYKTFRRLTGTTPVRYLKRSGSEHDDPL